MTIMTRYEPGTFCWFELGTNNCDASKSFYQRLFGWQVEDIPAGLSTYTILRKGDKDVGGIYELNEEQISMGTQPHWRPYVAVADVADSTRTALALGAA